MSWITWVPWWDSKQKDIDIPETDRCKWWECMSVADVFWDKAAEAMKEQQLKNRWNSFWEYTSVQDFLSAIWQCFCPISLSSVLNSSGCFPLTSQQLLKNDGVSEQKVNWMLFSTIKGSNQQLERLTEIEWKLWKEMYSQ